MSVTFPEYSLLDKYVKPCQDISVAALMADEMACGHYRVAYPIEFLRRAGAEVRIFKGFSVQDLFQFDVILAQRQHAPHVLEMLQELQFSGKTIIFEIDDNVHAVHPTSVAYSVYKPGSDTCHGIRKFMESCDGLFCSTPELASQYSEFSKRTWVLPNAIDYGIRDWETPVARDPRLEGKFVIGWMGSITHEADDAALKDCLRTVLEKYPNAVFAMVSAYRVMDQFVERLQLPADQVVCLDPTDFETYPTLPAQFDIGLIPVVNTTFNRAKSDLKILEYGIRGVPYVASRLAPYVRFHQESGGRGGYIVDSKEEWVDAISRLIENPRERWEKSEFIKTYVRENRCYDRCIHLWADAIREAKGMREYSQNTERKYVVREAPGRNSVCPCGSGIKYKKCCRPAWAEAAESSMSDQSRLRLHVCDGHVEIQLTRGYIAYADIEDYERIAVACWRAHLSKHTIYACNTRLGLLHRWLLAPDSDKLVDHINGDGLNCRRSNLRVCGHTENSRNRRKVQSYSSSFKGVHYHPQAEKWVASIKVNRKNLHLGLYRTEPDAAQVYDAAARYYFGEFSCTNFSGTLTLSQTASLSLQEQQLDLPEGISKRQIDSQSRKTTRSSSGYRGVSWHKLKNRWYSAISVDGKSIHLGSFGLPEEAAIAYDKAATKYYGVEAFTNFPISTSNECYYDQAG